jgi:hypothetical protein
MKDVILGLIEMCPEQIVEFSEFTREKWRTVLSDQLFNRIGNIWLGCLLGRS